MIIEWSEPSPPNEYCHYDHVEATWKGWKDYPSYDIEETPWGDYGGSSNTLVGGKVIAEDEWLKKLQACL